MIVARDLGRSYRGVRAVDGLSFEVRTGAVTGFLGPNGAGKSTTMRLMVGLVRGEGVTTFAGRPYARLRRPLSEVGTVLEARAAHPTRTARRHLAVLAASAGVGPRRVEEVLDAVGLLDVADDGPRTFSLGMLQRLAIAGALIGDPQYLLLDEPANGLDPQGIGWLRRLLRDLAADGRGILVSSHLLAETAQLADDVVVVASGRLVASGSVGDFIGSFTQGVVVVRSPDAVELAALLHRAGYRVEVEPDATLLVTGAEPAAVGELAASAGAVLHELSVRRASLEDAFLEATVGGGRHGGAALPWLAAAAPGGGRG